MPHRFRGLCPPLVETFAHRNGRACRVEEGSQPGADHDTFGWTVCPNGHECERTALGLPLDLVYRGGYKVTMTESSSSLIIRSEHQFSGDDRLRMSRRKHLHEWNGDLEYRIVVTQGIRDAILEDFTTLRNTGTCVSTIAVDVQPVAAEGITQEFKDRLDRLIDLLRTQLDVLRANNVYWWRDEKDRAQQEFKNWILATFGVGDQLAKQWAKQIVAHIFAPMRCHEISPNDEFGKYLGYVDLRLNSMAAPLAMGLLVAPRHLRHDHRCTYIEGEYSSLFGANGFRSTVYTMHEPDFGGARCAQACVIMTTALLADRGAKLRGSYELTYLANKRQTAFDVDGLSFRQTFKLLKRRGPLKTTADRFRYGPDESDNRGLQLMWLRNLRRLAERLIEAYVIARCPVILFVDSKTWNPAYQTNDVGHAVVVTGFRRMEHETVQSTCPDNDRGLQQALLPDLLSHLIVHDPGLRPYALWPTDACVFASTKYQETAATSPGFLNLIFASNDTIKRHAMHYVRKLAKSYSYLVEWIPENRWFMKYWTSPGCDLRIALVHRDDIIDTYFGNAPDLYAGEPEVENVAEYARQQLKETVARIRRDFPRGLQNGWYWAFAGYENTKLRTLWLCNSSDSFERRPWEWRFHVYTNGLHQGNSPKDPAAIWLGETDLGVAPLARQTKDRHPEPLPPLHPEPQEVAGQVELQASVITSSSERSLEKLVEELVVIDQLANLDLFVLRERDVRDMITAQVPGFRLLDPESPTAPLPLDKISKYASADIMAVDANVPRVRDWVLSRLAARPSLRLPAFASYFPQITNETNASPQYAPGRTCRAIAVDAIANSVWLGLELQRARATLGNAHPDAAILEIVCGSKLDRDNDRVQVADDATHIKGLLDSLQEVRVKVEQKIQDHGNGQFGRWAIGVEIEPGSTYTLRDHSTLGLFCRTLRSPAYQALWPHVGLNVDIGHMRMAGLWPDLVRHGHGEQWSDLVVHAHITDHPGIHSRDQRLGSWMLLDRLNAEEYRWLLNIAEAWHNRPQDGLPHSNCVALELEGCGRIRWIHSSLNALRQMCETTRHFGNAIRNR